MGQCLSEPDKPQAKPQQRSAAPGGQKKQQPESQQPASTQAAAGNGAQQQLQKQGEVQAQPDGQQQKQSEIQAVTPEHIDVNTTTSNGEGGLLGEGGCSGLHHRFKTCVEPEQQPSSPPACTHTHTQELQVLLAVQVQEHQGMARQLVLLRALLESSPRQSKELRASSKRARPRSRARQHACQVCDCVVCRMDVGA